MFRRRSRRFPLLGSAGGASILYDLNFGTGEFFGGTQPGGDNLTDGRFFRQYVSPTTPNFAEREDFTLQRFTASTVRYVTGRGVVIEADRFNRVLWSNDLTNAAWVKTNASVVKNQTCRAGLANNASRVTVGADGATIMQARTLTSLALSSWMDIRRVSGSGTAEFTVDNGATWGLLNLDAPLIDGWCRGRFPEQTIENPTWGFRFSTSGDVFDIAYVNSVGDVGVSETTEFGPSPITTSTQIDANRDRPAAYTADGSPIADYFSNRATRAFLIEFAARRAGGLLTGDVQNIAHTGNFSAGAQAFGGAAVTGNAVLQTTSYHNPVWNKVFMWQTADETGICLNGGTIVTSGGAAPLSFDHIDLGTNGAGTLAIDGWIRRMTFYSGVPDDATIQALTAI